jgi:putative ABC transport system permease protein
VILIAFFAVTALLAIPGVFGVMAYSLSRRTRKFGVRVAPGATPADLVPMVLGQGMRTILIGVAIESVGSLALTQTVSLLFGVTATDPVIFGGATLLLMVAALLAY